MIAPGTMNRTGVSSTKAGNGFDAALHTLQICEKKLTAALEMMADVERALCGPRTDTPPPKMAPDNVQIPPGYAGQLRWAAREVERRADNVLERIRALHDEFAKGASEPMRVTLDHDH